jgi:hypothetical protein
MAIDEPDVFSPAGRREGALKLLVEASTLRHVILQASPTDVATYFSHNSSLLGALVGDDRVEDLGDNGYRVRPLAVQLLGLDWSPRLVVQFHDLPGVTRMTSRDCVIPSPVPWGPSAVARVEGEAHFDPHGPDTRLACVARAEVELLVTPPWSWAPENAVHHAVQLGLQAAMEALANRFPMLIRQDFLSWQHRRRAGSPS